ncbi:MAG: ABC transporter ATP-binding protein [Pseudomonadota bacterium]
MSLLEIEALHVRYGPVHALKGVELSVDPGTISTVLGANGAGKTTLLMAVAGARRWTSGDIRFEGQSLAKMAPEDIVQAGIGLCPEGRRVFTALTVAENLQLAGAVQRDAGRAKRLTDQMFNRFPILAERAGQRAGLLSGGEQQMLAVARALMATPRLLLMDEPSLGLAPQMVDTVFNVIKTLREEGITVLLVEQNVPRSLAIADHALVLATGTTAASGPPSSLEGGELVRAAYLTA